MAKYIVSIERRTDYAVEAADEDAAIDFALSGDLDLDKAECGGETTNCWASEPTSEDEGITFVRDPEYDDDHTAAGDAIGLYSLTDKGRKAVSG